MAMLSKSELSARGFAHVGKGALVSSLASFYGVERISIGDYARIDDFCVISAGAGGIAIGRHVHVAAHCILVGQGRIELRDYSGLSGRVSVYSSSDDYSGKVMTNPTIPAEGLDIDSAPVVVGEHVIVGAGSVILPGATLATGAAVGALSVVRGDLEEFTIYSGNPVRRVRTRSRALLDVLALLRNKGLLE